MGNGSFIVDGGTSGLNTSGFNGTLPIELAFFKAEMQNVGVIINWQTITEINNDYFTIERSIDGKKFRQIGLIPGNGNSERRINYKFIDRHPFQGLSYYRLIQTDFDGTTEAFQVIAVDNDQSFYQNMTLYPNPLGETPLRLLADGLKKASTTQLSLDDLSGRSLMELSAESDLVGQLKLDLTDISDLPQGIYILTLTQGQLQISRKFLKE
jgi:hypothetical protein